MFRSLMLSSAMCGTILVAHPKKMTVISGPGIQLHSIDHGFAGSIKGRTVLGFKKHGSFKSEISIVENDRKAVSNFYKIQGEKFGGSLILHGANGPRGHAVQMIEFVRDQGLFIFSFAGERVAVSVSAEAFEAGHYINPEYSMTYKGEEVSFKIENGQACYGYSMHLIAMIMSAYIF